MVIGKKYTEIKINLQGIILNLFFNVFLLVRI